MTFNVRSQVERVIAARGLADAGTPVLLMVSGGSDSTAMAYLAASLHERGAIGPLGMVHVNHHLRGADADGDARFVRQLAEVLDIPLTVSDIDVAAIASEEHGNVEAVARRERYAAAREALEGMCLKLGVPTSAGRVFAAHTVDDRIENFYMRSIVGTGPGGFRSMRYLNGQVARPLLDCARDDLRAYILERTRAGLPVARDAEGNLWREDATNKHTDRFRAYVRHEIVPRAAERNPRLRETLTRTMNQIADEDDMMVDLADEAASVHVTWYGEGEGCLIGPGFADVRLPVQRRVVAGIIGCMLGPDERIESASVEAVLAGFVDGKPNGGYVVNIQGNLAVSANKHGMRIEPMAAFRTRRKRA